MVKDLFIKQRGNALFLILIAVALFAALSYAVTNSGRGGGGIDREQASIDASILLQQGATLASAVQKMRILNGTQPEQLEFMNDVYVGFYNGQHDNPTCNDNSCKVFHPDGGGISFPIVPKNIIDDCAATCAESYSSNQDPYWRFFGSNVIRGLGSDLKFEVFAGVRVSKQHCIAINQQLDIPNPSGEPPVAGSSTHMQSFNGPANLSDDHPSSNTFPAVFDNKYTGCFRQPHPMHGNERYIFFYVLAGR